MMTRLEAAYDLIEIASRKEKEGDLRRAHMAYEKILVHFMHLSFVECDDVEGVESWLSCHPLELVTDRFVTITEEVLSKPQLEWGRFFQGGNYLLVAFSHFFELLGQHSRARFFAQTAAQPVLYSTVFWGEYAQTLWALTQRQSYTPILGNLKPVEQYWASYVRLMQAAVRSEDFDIAVKEVDRQFELRNRDIKLHEDAYMLDGTGEFPVKFDFRKAGVLAAISSTRLQVVS